MLDCIFHELKKGTVISNGNNNIPNWEVLYAYSLVLEENSSFFYSLRTWGLCWASLETMWHNFSNINEALYFPFYFNLEDFTMNSETPPKGVWSLHATNIPGRSNSYLTLLNFHDILFWFLYNSTYLIGMHEKQ